MSAALNLQQTRCEGPVVSPTFNAVGHVAKKRIHVYFPTFFLTAALVSSDFFSDGTLQIM